MAQPLVGLVGLVMIVLGLLFWSGNVLMLQSLAARIKRVTAARDGGVR